MPPDVQIAMAALPARHAGRLRKVRRLAFDVAGDLPETGGLREYLAWGQPSYRPRSPNSGSAIRLGVHVDGDPALFVHCGTGLISEFSTFAGHLRLVGKRAVLLPLADPLPEAELRVAIELAFTYSSCRPR